MQYLGDFAEDATVYIPFNTFSSDDPSASVTITNLADADVMVHKDAGLTQIATDGATVAIDFDGITGNHIVTIDTSVHADYSTGSDYLVRIEGTTVDGATVNAWIGHFSIQNRYMRGTDSALLASSAPANFGDLAITATTGRVTVGANNDKAGYSLTVTTGLGNQTASITGNLSGSVGSVTGAINTAAGTITTLDGLDTAQDTQHGTTQSAITGLTDIDATGVRAAVGLAAANLDTQLDALPTAAENATAALTTQMTESYAANGTAPTLAQAQFAIHQALMQFGIAGTALTVRRLDNTTTAFVVTLDDAAAPTDARRV